ncbi:MAG: hypothetical protein K2N64_03920 [Anaeroplasmataceae bacterium]|nr:hypothetical protein [Anaeroplasmataceae bacterium]
MKKLIFVLLFSLGMFGISSATMNAHASESEFATNEKMVVDLLATHLNEFKIEYNEKFDECFEATGIEGYCSAYLVDANQYGVYIDFNGENGYLVTTFDLEIYGMETTGDLSYLKNEDFVYYSSVDGFLYFDGSQYQKYGPQERQAGMVFKNTTLVNERDANPVYGYAGQSGSGEGEIYNLDKYVADRYPSYKLVKKNDAIFRAGYTPLSMRQTSYFCKWISTNGGNSYNQMQTEHSCAILAAVNVMRAWKKTNFFPNFPEDSEIIDVREEIQRDDIYLYDTYGTGHGGIGIDSYWTANSDSVLSAEPKLYYWARYYATAACHYTPVSGMTTPYVRTLFTACTTQFRQTQYSRDTTNFTDIMYNLDEGKAVFMGVANSTSFGEDHAVALLGYAQYTYTTGVWIFSKTHTAYFYLIDDGRYNTVEYFDPNCNSKLSYEFVFPRPE